MMKAEMKTKIIELSIDYSIVTQFTSFVAIEEREVWTVSRNPKWKWK